MNYLIIIISLSIALVSVILFIFMSIDFKNELQFKKLCKSHHRNEELVSLAIDESMKLMKKEYKYSILFLLMVFIFSVATSLMFYLKNFTDYQKPNLELILSCMQALSVIVGAIFITIINYRKNRFM